MRLVRRRPFGRLGTCAWVFLVAGLGCFACGRERSAAEQDSGAASQAPANGADPATLMLTRVTRLTPEQVSRILQTRLNYQMGWKDAEGRFVDGIRALYGVPLGGVDFTTAFERDPSPKVHTILVSRSLAWNVAAELLWWESDPKASGKEARTRVLTIANPKSDFPIEAAAVFPWVQDAAARDARWRAQLDDVYWRLLARPPRPEETQACAEAFAKVVKIHKWPPVGWQIVLYSLLSTAEFWNLWGEK